MDITIYDNFQATELRKAARMFIPGAGSRGGLAHVGKMQDIKAALFAAGITADEIKSALTSADFLRRFGFASLELAMHDAGIEDVVRKCNSDCYGSAVHGYPAGKHYDIYCPAVINENKHIFDTAESSACWVTELIDRYNAGTEQMIVA